MWIDVHRSTRGELLSRSLSDNSLRSELLEFTIHITNTRNMEHINCKVYDLYTRGAGSYLGRDTDSPATGFVFPQSHQTKCSDEPPIRP
jgi:hypothetical protein